jgi:NTE family protein
LETRRLEAEVALERDRTAVGCPGDTTCRRLDNRNDATGAHAGLRRALTPKTCPIKLYLAATNVRTGKIKVFDNSKIGVEAVLASACLPFIFQAVEIDGEAHWDSGYMSNPQIFPLIYGCNSRDLVIVHINPLRREKLPTTASEIMNRINEISFNSSLMRAMRAIAFVTKLIDDGKILDNSMKRMLIHGIEAADVMAELGALNKLNADWDNLTHLMKVGRERTDAWLQKNFGRLGTESTVDIPDKFL